ncbi:MAG: 50S ribosomal protein L6 [Spirochaetales bacterium]|nr:50S ribosomal protein L6 [Spirochaetales bacterium]
MSRVGKAPITLPGGVTLEAAGSEVKVKGPKGALSSPLPPGISLSVEGNQAVLKRRDDSGDMKRLHGMARAILNNHVTGVSTGWKKNLELVGVGYRARSQGSQVVFSLGYSHDVPYDIPEGIKVDVTDQIRLEVTGIDKQKVGQVAAEMRSLRPPEPYKGKGVKYANERIRRKAGKTGKGGKK